MPRKKAVKTGPMPTWVTATPKNRNARGVDPTGYELAMFNNGPPDQHQYVKLSRTEFIALKSHLARRRGYPQTEETDAE